MTLVAVADHGNAYILALQIAQSSTFQTVVGEANQAAAMDHIHYPVADFDETGAVVADIKPPRAIICDELGDEEFDYDSPQKYNVSESWWLSFDFPVPAAYLSEGGRVNEWAWFHLQYKTILQDVRALGATGNPVGSLSYMRIASMRRIEGPYRLDPAEFGVLDDPATTTPSVIWHVAYEVTRNGVCS